LLKACLFNDPDLRKPLSNCWRLRYEFAILRAGLLAITTQVSVSGGKVKTSRASSERNKKEYGGQKEKVFSNGENVM
jgi:hypothetical protein